MAKQLGKEIWVVGAKRTAFGAFGGALKDFTATDLAVVASRGAIAQSTLKPEEIDEVIFGNVQQAAADAIYLARHVGLRSGLPIRAPALTVNRLCGSGFQSVVNAAERILLGDAEFVLAGGTESMSQAPHVVRGARWGLPFGKAGALGDTLWDALTDTFTGMPMAITAENLAVEYKISRPEVDQYALRSQQAWAAAHEAGRFRDEIVPVEVKSRPAQFLIDEHPRPQTTPEGLAKLGPVFKKDGVVTAGNASGICDGAAALVICSREAAERRELRPLGRIVQWGIEGCDPKIMGIGPVPACRAALDRAGLALADCALVEVNEAFAAQYLAVERELKLDRSRTNVDGGAVALGHPLGASGARILTHLFYALRQCKGRFGLGSACIGGGQGIALVVEALQ